jgi:hypothetical protein
MPVTNAMPRVPRAEDIDELDPAQHHGVVDLPTSSGEGNPSPLARFLRVLRSLEDLEINYLDRPAVRELTPTMRQVRPHERLFHDVLQLDVPLKLSCCNLRGVCAREVDLLEFLKRTAVSELTLQSVFLTTGSFRRIFDYCTRAASSLAKLDFDVLYEMDPPERVVRFLGAGCGPSRLGWVAPAVGDVSLERHGDAVKLDILYTHVSHLEGFGEDIRRWRTAQCRKHGNSCARA